MQINIRLNRNFSAAFNRMLDRFGEDMARWNGFSEPQLSYTDFIDNFIDKSVADASIDGNANVSHKDIVTLENEMSKPHSKLLVFNKIYYELNKKFGFVVANDWLESEWDGHFYLHDAYNASMKPYSYKGTETIVVKYNGEVLLTTFSQLYDIVKGEEVLLSEEDMAYCKYASDLFVWDKDDVWTHVVRVIRKPKTEKFHFIKTDNGMSEVVTANHPVITTSGDKLASDITSNDALTTQSFTLCDFGNIDTVYCLEELKDSGLSMLFRGESDLKDRKGKGQVCCSGGMNPIQNKIDLDFDFGWLVGIIIAEGNFQNDNVEISQNKGPIFDKIIEVLEDKNFGYCVCQHSDENYKIKIRSKIFTALIRHSFMDGQYSWNKMLNPSILKYNKTFIKGIVGGILDGDGTLTQAQGRRIHLRMTSRGLLNQLAFIIRMFGYTVREQRPSLYKPYEESNIVQHRYIYHLAFTPYSDGESFDSIKIRNHGVVYSSKEQEGRYTNGKYTFGYGDKQVEQNIVLDEDTDEEVFDISVDTGHFMCNGILSHNCFAYDLERLVKEGLYFISNFNCQPPKHLCTYTDFVSEFVSWTCNRSSGAVGLPSFLIYSYYFWKKDVAEGYYLKSPEAYRDQSFQEIIYRLNQPFLRSGVQSAFTNFSIFDREYLISLFGGKEFPDGSLVIDHIDELIEYQKAFMRIVSDVRSQNMMTFPVLTYALLRKDGKFVDEKFARWCCEHNIKWSDANFYISEDVTSLSNCCRLVSDINELGYFNSIGGTALEVGSIKVNTINLARLAYENKTKENYLEALRKKTVLCLQVLDVVRHIIKRNCEKGLLPNYELEIIKLQSQYNTIGIIGIFEALQRFGFLRKDEFGMVFYTEEGMEFAETILKTITEVKTEFAQNVDYRINIEEVPAERAAAVLMEKDKFFFPNQKYTLPLYGNQWIPLGVQTTLQEKVRLSARLDKACSGGSIAHINIDAPFNSVETAWNMLNYVADQGVTYFAFCIRISACKNNHGFYGEVCPICGEKKATTYQRIVGFLTPENSYSNERKREFLMRDWMDVNTREV